MYYYRIAFTLVWLELSFCSDSFLCSNSRTCNQRSLVNVQKCVVEIVCYYTECWFL